jgi:hypothetical protein
MFIFKVLRQAEITYWRVHHLLIRLALQNGMKLSFSKGYWICSYTVRQKIIFEKQ